jgi:hypothetical protein
MLTPRMDCRVKPGNDEEKSRLTRGGPGRVRRGKFKPRPLQRILY